MISTFGLLVVALVEVGLGVAVLSKNPERPANRWFAAFAGCLAAWGALVAVSPVIGDPAVNLVRSRGVFAASPLIPMTFLRFAAVFPNPPLRESAVIRAATWIGLVVSALAFSPWIVTGVRLQAGSYRAMYGPLHPIFVVYFLTCAVWTLTHLARKVRRERSFPRARLQYLFVGAGITCLAAVTTNLIMPLVFRTHHLSGYGPYFTLILLGFIAHSIIRHRLMDIRIVISRSVAYAAGWAVISGILVAGGVLLGGLVLGKEPTPFPAVAVGLGLAAALCFILLAPHLKALADQYLYRSAYDTRQLVRDGSRVVATVTDPESVAWALAALIDKALRIESLAIVGRHPDRDEFQPLYMQHIDPNFSWPREPLRGSSPIVRQLLEGFDVFTIDDLSRRPETLEARSLASDLRAWAAEVAVPVRGDRDVKAILLLGPKLSGDPYFRDDIDLLETLASQLAIGLENAKLYHQVVSIKEYNERILAHMDSGVVAVREDGTVTTFNQAAERSTGHQVREIIGQSMGSLDPAIQGVLKGSLAGQQDAEAEIVMTRPDGHTLPLLVRASALHDASGQIRGAIAVFNDHSRLKALEEDKRRAERLAAVGALASGIAHEIRNPLVAIKTFAELLPERADDQEFRSTFAKVAVKEIHRIEELLGQLRALATPAASSRTPVNLAVPILETLDLLRGEADRRHVQLIGDVPVELPAVVGEASQLKQLFVNLVLNGLEAMGSGGRLTVALRASQDWSGHRLVTVRVIDTGPGIPREELSRIFEPFFTTKAHGTGLGLAICRGIADAHRAALWAESGPDGLGTAFVVQFPAMADVHVAETVG